MKQQHFMVIPFLAINTSWILLNGFQNHSLLLFAKVPTTAIPLLLFEASAVAVRGFNRGVGVHRVTK